MPSALLPSLLVLSHRSWEAIVSLPFSSPRMQLWDQQVKTIEKPCINLHPSIIRIQRSVGEEAKVPMLKRASFGSIQLFIICPILFSADWRILWSKMCIMCKGDFYPQYLHSLHKLNKNFDFLLSWMLHHPRHQNILPSRRPPSQDRSYRTIRLPLGMWLLRVGSLNQWERCLLWTQLQFRILPRLLFVGEGNTWFDSHGVVS